MFQHAKNNIGSTASSVQAAARVGKAVLQEGLVALEGHLIPCVRWLDKRTLYW